MARLKFLCCGMKSKNPNTHTKMVAVATVFVGSCQKLYEKYICLASTFSPNLIKSGESLSVGEIIRKCGFVNQKIRGRRQSNFLSHEFTLSNGFSGLNH